MVEMEKEMKAAAKNLDFEQAALLRDEISRIKKILPMHLKK
jgi:excinuclease UvrABC nuclease subunit